MCIAVFLLVVLLFRDPIPRRTDEFGQSHTLPLSEQAAAPLLSARTDDDDDERASFLSCVVWFRFVVFCLFLKTQLRCRTVDDDDLTEQYDWLKSFTVAPQCHFWQNTLSLTRVCSRPVNHGLTVVTVLTLIFWRQHEHAHETHHATPQLPGLILLTCVVPPPPRATVRGKVKIRLSPRVVRLGAPRGEQARERNIAAVAFFHETTKGHQKKKQPANKYPSTFVKRVFFF